MIFQQFNLISRLSLLSNVLLGRLGRKAHLTGIDAKLKRLAVWAQAEVATDAPQPQGVASAG